MTLDAESNRIEELEQDNRRLRRLLDQRDAPGELRHRLRTTLGLLTAVVRRSLETPRDLASYAAHLEDRIDAITHAQFLADQFGEVDLRTLIADEMLKYGALEGERVFLTGPALVLTPRVGQMMALAIHELAVNAVEHGGLGVSDGRIDVTWTTDAERPGRLTRLTWTETGGETSAAPAHRGFGTEVLTRMLPYECGAETEIEFGADGLRCVVRFPGTHEPDHVVPSDFSAVSHNG